MSFGEARQTRKGVAAALAGDRAAIGHRHNVAAAVLHRDIAAILPRLKRYAHKLTRDPEDADDLVHDCIARTRKGPSLETGDGFAGVVVHDSAK